MRRITVLRPEPGAGTTVDRARQRGLEAAAIPLFRIEPVEWNVPEAGSFGGLLLTSANAVRHGGEGLKQLRGLRAYAVGDATAEAAREAGFDIAATGDSGVERLLGSLEADLKLLHLCGEHRHEMPDVRQSITPVVVYRSMPLDADLKPAAGSVVLVHSPRAAEAFAQGCDRQRVDRGSIRIAAISAAAAEKAGQGWDRIEAAEQSTDEALLAVAERLCDNGAAE